MSIVILVHTSLHVLILTFNKFIRVICQSKDTHKRHYISIFFYLHKLKKSCDLKISYLN